MDRFTHFGLRSDADEQLRRAVRDGFKRAGLSHAQLTQAMEWYRDCGQHMGPDPAKLTESFMEFAASKHWPPEHRDAAKSVYGTVRDYGPAALIAPTSPEQDAATIARPNCCAPIRRPTGATSSYGMPTLRPWSARRGPAPRSRLRCPDRPRHRQAPRPRQRQPYQSVVSTSNATTR
jgi:hypothetical protein